MKYNTRDLHYPRGDQDLNGIELATLISLDTERRIRAEREEGSDGIDRLPSGEPVFYLL